MGQQLILNATATIGTDSVQLTPQLNDGQTKLITFVNTSALGQNITLSLGVPAEAGKGIVLYPTMPYAESIDNNFTPSNLAWYAIGSAAGATLAIHQRTE